MKVDTLFRPSFVVELGSIDTVKLMHGIVETRQSQGEYL